MKKKDNENVGFFSTTRFWQLLITLLLLCMVIGQMLILRMILKVDSLWFVGGLPLLSTAILFGLSALLMRFAAPPVPSAQGLTENAQALKELLPEMKGVKKMMGVLEKEVQTLSDDLKAQRTFLQRRLRRLRSRQRQILDHLGLVDTPDQDGGLPLDLNSLLDDETNSLRQTELREQLSLVSKEDLNLLQEVLIELLERKMESTTIDDAPQE